ncbi:rho GTPase-activating protein 20-like isoform X2 [Betta splendens]|uniref:Rho GTPase-activating protein 20-like isoform X2 n=1 Tax=Betta splendens TaxID=158456 RepID=A0A6P7LVR0_BETSP|nr:rho GTPase-activating protein 20-like isoform X2 [Betta splendens]
MDNMSPQQQQDSLGGGGGGGQQDNKRRMKSQSYRRQSAPSMVITKALTRSKTLSRETLFVPASPETCSLVQSFLTGSDRSFLLHVHAQLKTGMQTQYRHLFLFNDTLVVAKAKSANHFKLKAQVRMCEMWTASCMEEVCEGSTSPERSFVMGWPTCNCVAVFSSVEHKDKWLSVLKSQIKEEKEKEEPKTIPLRVYGKGINTFAVTKTLPVSNSDSTNEVIRLALQQFGIIGNVKDFQLWVISKRDNTPYPLIGHEFPFSIQMSHMRPSASQGGCRDTAAADKQRATPVEQLQAYKQCQFILRPRPNETFPQPVCAEFSQKPFKRRRSLIAWAFWRGSSSHLSDLSLAGTPAGCLFGQPLSAVCVEGALPKAVMDMLAFLYHEGSWTRGIFRRPAGARAVRELRDSLDAGDAQLPLSRDHVFIIAGVFKDFVRSIPGSLLCSELHEEWTDVLEEGDEEEEQVQDVRRMICRLPKDNVLLLRYILAMLHGVQGNAHENQMTSFNLSVCIAPSILWPPGAPGSPEVEGEGTKKVCELVKFMIEHCQQILGEDPSSLFGGPPQRPNTEETASDSSYDSLENELDNSSGGSPSVSSRRPLCPKPLQTSLDSILTLSDCDQDADPDVHHMQPESLRGLKSHRLGRTRGRRPNPDPVLDSVCLDGGHTLRRRSEPAIAYVAKFRPCVAARTDDRTSKDEEGEGDFAKTSCSYITHAQSGDQSWGPGEECGLNLNSGGAAVLEASSSSLSSTPNSPALTTSSLDSLSSDQTWVTRRGTHPTKAQLASSGSLSTSVPSADLGPTNPKSSPPREPLTWGTLKSCRGLHPNSWLKKDRRLSLTHQDNLDKEDEDKSAGGPADKLLSLGPEKGKAGDRGGAQLMSSSQPKPKPPARLCKDAAGGGNGAGRAVQWPHKPQQLKHDSSSPPSHHRSTDSLLFPRTPWFQASDSPMSARQLSADGGVSNQRAAAQSEGSEPKQSGSHKQSGPSLSLFKQCSAKLHQRRGSEPARQIVGQASTFTRARLPSDPGLKVSEVDSHAGTAEARFCLSPCATKAVREYFSSHPCSSPQSSQQVALALVESHREWLKRCSNPSAEPDFDQLLFAEESYV